MAEISLKEFGGSSSDDVSFPTVMVPPERNKEASTGMDEAQSKLTQGRKRAIATFLILGNSILVSNLTRLQ
jgi:hypothetical protein